MSTKHVRTPADLARFGWSLKITCMACGAANTLRAVEAVKRCGASASLNRLHSRLKCDRCGAKAAKLAVLPPV